MLKLWFYLNKNWTYVNQPNFGVAMVVNAYLNPFNVMAPMIVKTVQMKSDALGVLQLANIRSQSDVVSMNGTPRLPPEKAEY